MTEPFDVGALPRLAGDQILGDEARLGGGARRDVGVRQLRLRFVHSRFESAIDADLDQLEQRRDLRRHARDQLLQDTRGVRVVVGRYRGVDRGLDTDERGVPRRLGERPPEFDDLMPEFAVVREQLPHQLARRFERPRSELDVHEREQQRGILPCGFAIEIHACRLEVSGGNRLTPELDASFLVVGIEAHGFAQRRKRVLLPSLLEQIPVKLAVAERREENECLHLPCSRALSHPIGEGRISRQRRRGSNGLHCIDGFVDANSVLVRKRTVRAREKHSQGRRRRTPTGACGLAKGASKLSLSSRSTSTASRPKRASDDACSSSAESPGSAVAGGRVRIVKGREV